MADIQGRKLIYLNRGGKKSNFVDLVERAYLNF